MASCTAKWLPSHIYCMITISITHEWAEEKMRPLWAVRMCSVPTKSQGFRNFHILLLHQPLWDMTSLSYEWYLPLTMLCVDDDNVALSSLLAAIVHTFIHSNQMLYIALNQRSFFSFEVYRSPQMKQCRVLPSKRYCSWLQKFPCVSQAV